MSPDVGLAVQVTIVGMVLVFLTLIICALVISVLSRFFPPKPEAEEGEAEEEAAPVLSAAAPAHASSVLAASSDEAAAIALALALARQTSQPVRYASAPARSAMPWSRAPQSAAEDETITGEVITVTAIDPGASTWSAYGRVKATQ